MLSLNEFITPIKQGFAKKILSVLKSLENHPYKINVTNLNWSQNSIIVSGSSAYLQKQALVN